MFCRMVIGEAISDNQLQEFCSVANEDEPELLKQPGAVKSDLWIEDDGNMVVVLTVWENREHCLRYHGSRTYRQFVAKTQHLFVGNFVVKLFRAG